MEIVSQLSPLHQSDQVPINSDPQPHIIRLPKPKPKAAINDDGWNHLEGNKPQPLEGRFSDVKASLIKPENYATVQASWDRLLIALQERTSDIASSSSNVIQDNLTLKAH